MSFLREHLQLTHYSWNESLVLDKGEPTRRLFNRENGFQVLFIINACRAFMESFTIKEGRDIEKLIGNQLPLEIKSEISVFRWLRSVFFNDWLGDVK